MKTPERRVHVRAAALIGLEVNSSGRGRPVQNSGAYGREKYQLRGANLQVDGASSARGLK
jgi:hypothetical protein